VECERSPALDAERLRELDRLGERAVALVDRAIDNFVAGLPQVLVDLEDAIGRGDADELRTTAHRLRGSALNLGARRVADVTLEMELLDEAAGAPRAHGLLHDLGEAAAAAATALRDYQELERPRPG
jgi:HPt (histidine-containing phosphotransfer) domain-containing protein